MKLCADLKREKNNNNKRSNLIKRICTLVPRRGGEARFDKSDMWADRARWELNPSLLKKKVWNGVTEESVLQKKEKTDFGFVAFRLCKRMRKCVCALLLIHFYFRSELSFPRENVSNECRKTALISFNVQKRVDRHSFPEDMHKLDSSTSCQRTKPLRASSFFLLFLSFQAFWIEKVKIEFENLIFIPVWWS